MLYQLVSAGPGWELPSGVTYQVRVETGSGFESHSAGLYVIINNYNITLNPSGATLSPNTLYYFVDLIDLEPEEIKKVSIHYISKDDEQTMTIDEGRITPVYGSLVERRKNTRIFKKSGQLKSGIHEMHLIH